MGKNNKELQSKSNAKLKANISESKKKEKREKKLLDVLNKKKKKREVFVICLSIGMK